MPIAFDRHQLARPSLLRGTNPPPCMRPNSPLGGESKACEGSWVAMSPAWRTPLGRQAFQLEPQSSAACLSTQACTTARASQSTNFVAELGSPHLQVPRLHPGLAPFRVPLLAGCRRLPAFTGTGCNRASATEPRRCLGERAFVGGQHTWRPRCLALGLRGGKESCLPPPRGETTNALWRKCAPAMLPLAASGCAPRTRFRCRGRSSNEDLKVLARTLSPQHF